MVTRFRQNDELSAFVAPPACRNGDAVLIVNGVPKFAGIEELSLRERLHGKWELVHSNPLSSTFNHFARKGVNKKLTPICRRSLHPQKSPASTQMSLRAQMDMKAAAQNRLQPGFSRRADRLFDSLTPPANCFAGHRRRSRSLLFTVKGSK